MYLEHGYGRFRKRLEVRAHQVRASANVTENINSNNLMVGDG